MKLRSALLLVLVLALAAALGLVVATQESSDPQDESGADGLSTAEPAVSTAPVRVVSGIESQVGRPPEANPGPSSGRSEIERENLDPLKRIARAGQDPPIPRGGIMIGIRDEQGVPLTGFRLSVSQNPFPTAVGSWRVAGRMSLNGGSDEILTRRDFAYVPASWAPKCGLWVMPVGRAPFVAEGVECPPRGQPTRELWLDVAKTVGCAVRVVVTTAEGELWRNGTVRVVPEARNPNYGLARWFRGAWQESGASDFDGHYRITNLPVANSAEVQIRYGQQVLSSIAIGPLLEGQEISVATRLPALHAVEIRVHWDGVPIAGLWARGYADARAGATRPELYDAWYERTDAQGVFRWMVPDWANDLGFGLTRSEDPATDRGRELPTPKLHTSERPSQIARRLAVALLSRSSAKIMRPFPTSFEVDLAEVARRSSSELESLLEQELRSGETWTLLDFDHRENEIAEWIRQRDFLKVIKIGLR